MGSSIAQCSASRSSGSVDAVACSSRLTSAILSPAIVAVLPAEVRHQLEDHAVALAVKSLDLLHFRGHHFDQEGVGAWSQAEGSPLVRAGSG